MKKSILLLTVLIFLGFTMHGFGVDLKWRSPISISPVTPNSGDTVTFRCKLKSVGGPSDSILVEGRIDGVSVWDHTYSHFDTDEITWVEFTWVATGGTHTIAFVSDPHNTTGDTDPANNTRSISFDVTGSSGGDPEPTFDLLWVGDVSVFPSTPLTGSPVSFTANVKAVGSDISNVKVSLAIRTGHALRNTGSVILRNLSADTPQAVTISWTTPFAGDHTAILSVDLPKDSLRTEDRANNRISKAFTVREPGLMTPLRARDKAIMKPKIPRNMMLFGEAACEGNEDKTIDLQVTRFKADPVRGNPERKRITVRIKNNGLKCVHAFRFDVTDNYGQLIHRQSVFHLPGKRYALTGNTSRVFNFTFDKAIVQQIGTCSVSRTIRTHDGRVIQQYTDKQCSKLRVTVDPDNEIGESQEGNNRFGGLTIHWGGLASRQ